MTNYSQTYPENFV